MAYFLFIDESGQDHRQSPYEVLGGVTILDRDLWNLIREIQEVELACFGRQYRTKDREIKATKFLKTKTFRLAAQMEPIPLQERQQLAKEALENGIAVTKLQLTALSQAKLDYVWKVIELCHQYRCKIFASIVGDPALLSKDQTLLRKDYVYLFERFYYFLEDKRDEPNGIVVFDELDKSQSHILVGQMDKYFKQTQKGRTRSGLVIPEPFFVHSDLTTGIQIVDFVAYILSWSFRIGKLVKPSRPELEKYLVQLKPMRYRTTREIDEISNHEIWSVTVV